jgi:hypothetical protein
MKIKLKGHQFHEVLGSPYETDLSSGINKDTVTANYKHLVKEFGPAFETLLIQGVEFKTLNVGNEHHYIIVDKDVPIFYAKTEDRVSKIDDKFISYMQSKWAWRNKAYSSTKDLLIMLYFHLHTEWNFMSSNVVSTSGKTFWVRFAKATGNKFLFINTIGKNSYSKVNQNIDDCFSTDLKYMKTSLLFLK